MVENKKNVVFSSIVSVSTKMGFDISNFEKNYVLTY